MRQQAIREWLYEGKLPSGPRWWRGIALAGRVLTLAAVRFQRDRGSEKAGSLAYGTLLALLPVLVLAISAIEFLQPSQQTDIVAWVVAAVFPPEADEVRQGFLDYVRTSRTALEETAAAGTSIRIASAALLLWFAANLVTGVDRMVGDIWGTGSIKRFMRRLASYWAVATIGPLLLALSIAGTAILRSEVSETAGRVIGSVLPFLVTWLSAFAFFRLMPHTGARSGAAAVGALVAGTLWESSKLALGWYLSMPRSLLTSLSFFPAAILWMYASWAIGIYGIEITYVVHHGSWRPGRRAGRRELRGRPREEITLGAAVAIAREFDEGRLPDRTRMAEILCVGEDEIAPALASLASAGLVVAEDSGGYRPARGAAGIPALAAVDAARGAPGAASLSPETVEFLDELEARGREAVESVTLQDLATGRRAPPAA